MTKWTDRQLMAITARNRQILVSAAAGSGKTAVLIERVMSLLREGKSLDRMLVVTFTRAAAEEMKERLSEKLAEAAQGDAHLRRQFMMLGRADISTLHSFCQKLLKRYFQAAGIDPLFHLAEEAVKQELYTQALEDALDAVYETPGEEDQQLLDCFTEDELAPMVKSLLDFLLAQQDPWQWLEGHLKESAYQDLLHHPWYQVLTKEAGLLFSGARAVFQKGLDLCCTSTGPARYQDALLDDVALVDALNTLILAPGVFAGASPGFTRLPSQKAPANEDPILTQQVKDLRQQGKNLVAQAMALLPQGQAQADQWMAEVRATLPQLRALARLTRDVYDRYQGLKQQRQLLDFNDLEHKALLALSNESVRQEVALSYDALFVDEYQDVSQIQEAIIGKLQSPHNSLFMVGDVKQSIYRFRLADPGLFLSKSMVFDPRPEADARLITLRENFRSRENILLAVNRVFEHAMQQRVTEIAYDKEARLVTLTPDGGPPVELWMLYKPQDGAEEEQLPDMEDSLEEEEPGEEEGETAPPRLQGEMEQAFVYEARLIARRIRELVDSTAQEAGGGLRYRDMAVLLRTASSRAPVMADILSQAGIPAYSDADGGFFAQQSVRDALAILSVLDNPQNDIPLLHTLSCPAFSFTPQELADIRLSAPGRDIPFHQAFLAYAATNARSAQVVHQLARWRLMAQTQPLQHFIRKLLRQSGLYAVAGVNPDGQLQRANLRILAQRAAPNPQPQDLAGFLRRMNMSMEQNARDQSASLGLQEDVVRVMTLHKSKGLQFPVVFLPDLAANFSRKRRSLPLRLDAQTGLAIEQVHAKARFKKDGVGVTAIKTKRNREELSEEARLLYVGMTRAKERLILMGAPANLEQAMLRAAQPAGEYTAGAATSMLDWVLNPISAAVLDMEDGDYQAPGGSRWQVSFVSTADLQREEQQGSKEAEGGMEDRQAPAVSGDALAEQTGQSADPVTAASPALDAATATDVAMDDLFKLPPLGAALPQKISVTALVRGDYLKDEEETPHTKRQPWKGQEDDGDAVVSLALMAQENAGDSVGGQPATAHRGNAPAAYEEIYPGRQSLGRDGLVVPQREAKDEVKLFASLGHQAIGWDGLPLQQGEAGAAPVQAKVDGTVQSAVSAREAEDKAGDDTLNALVQGKTDGTGDTNALVQDKTYGAWETNALDQDKPDGTWDTNALVQGKADGTGEAVVTSDTTWPSETTESSIAAMPEQPAIEATEPPEPPLPTLPDFYPPGYQSPLTPAQRGAAAHKALCALPAAFFVNLRGQALHQALTTALDGLLAKGILSAPERAGIAIMQVADFYQSPLAQRLANSQASHAEWPFTLLVEDKLFLQGVLDACFLEDDQWVLIDYKTDWGSPQALLNRYRDQMRWYMRALREITGKPVKEAWLYLLRRGEVVEVVEGEGISLQ